MKLPTIGKVWAVCDHFQQETGNPVLASILKQSSGATRQQLRNWVREGRLQEYDVTGPHGQMQKGYSRPKAVEERAANG